MFGGMTMFGIPSVFRMLLASKGLPFGGSDRKDDSGVEITDEAAHACILAILAAGAGNSTSGNPWGSHW